MCGSYRICFSDTRIGKSILDEARKLNLKDFAVDDVFPKSSVLTIVPVDKKVTLSVKRWGIELYGKTLINARSETVYDKPFYEKMVGRRCAVPVSCFYEWNNRQRYQIRKENNDLFFLAGIYNENDELLIVTGGSDKDLKNIHSRSPVIFDMKQMLSYLNNETGFFVNNDDLLIEKNDKK